MTTPPNYEVYAIKYAEARRTAEECFLMPDPHESAIEMDYFVWLIRGAGRTVLVDTGFNHERAKARKRKLQRLPTEGLEVLGVKPGDVETVIVTHLHYDHAGNLDLFPEAEFIVQDKEVNFATGRYMRYKAARLPFEADDVTRLVRENYKGRVRFVDGDAELAPGIRLHLVGGHSRGLMSVSVSTKRGLVVLASDAAHFYANITKGNPFPIVADVPENCESHERLYRLAGDLEHLIPGHDPLVTKLFPAHAKDKGIVDLTAEPSDKIR